MGNSVLNSVAKEIGYKNASELCFAVDVSFHTLRNWKNNKPKRFLAMVAGAEKIKKDEQNGNSRNSDEH